MTTPIPASASTDAIIADLAVGLAALQPALSAALAHLGPEKTNEVLFTLHCGIQAAVTGVGDEVTCLRFGDP